VENLRASKIPVLGAVLNKRTFPIPEKIYNRL
jgi:Mrp family chromosome partitioning ATPase